MYKIAITENTYRFLESNTFFLLLEEIEDLKCKNKGTEYTISFELSANNVDNIYILISLIYEEKPNENNRWIFNNKEYLLFDEQPIRFFLSDFEGTDNYPLRYDILSDVIQNDKIYSLQELRKLAHQPFSGILSFNQFDLLRINRIGLGEDVSEHIKIEHKDICIKNRYIVNDLELLKGKINFSNCIFDGDIIISGSAKVDFSVSI